eukprot:5750879-Karenia_brevis.AAC.1
MQVQIQSHDDTSSNSTATSASTSEKNGIEEDSETNSDEEQVEAWVDWIRRTTHQVENKIQKMCLEDWATTYRRRQWKWAHKLVTHLANHWAGIAIKWVPETQGRNKARGRNAGRPKKSGLTMSS